METFKWQSSKPGRSNEMQTTTLAFNTGKTCQGTWWNTMLSGDVYIVCEYSLAASVIRKRSPEEATETDVL